MDSRDSRNKRRREEPEDAPTDPATSAPASSGVIAAVPDALPGAVPGALPEEGPGGLSEAVPQAVPDAVSNAAFGEAAGTDAMPDAAFGEAAGTDAMPDAAFGEAAMPDGIPDAAFGEAANPGQMVGDLEGLEEEFGQAATEAALSIDVGMAELPDLQWSGAGDAPFTGMASADQIEVALSPLWRLSTRLLGDASTRAAGLQLRQRFSFFSTCPGAVETLLSLIPVLGEQEDQELLEGPMDAVDPGANQLGAILEYLPVVRPTQDVGVLTTDLVAHHSEQQARALTGLFLHTTGITSVDVRTMIGNENLGLTRRAFWRGRELLIQQLGAVQMYQFISDITCPRFRDTGRNGAAHYPGSSKYPRRGTRIPIGRAAPDFAGETAPHGLCAEATNSDPRRCGSSCSHGRDWGQCWARPRGHLQLDRSFGWLGSQHR